MTSPNRREPTDPARPPPAVPSGRRPPAMLASVAGSLAVLGSALVPWSRSGTRTRNAFELAQVADDLGEIDSNWARLALTAWLAVPVLVAGVWLGATFIRPYVVTALAGTVGAMGVLAGAAVLVSPLRTAIGPWLAVPAGAITLVAATRLVLNRGAAPTEQRQQ